MALQGPTVPDPGTQSQIWLSVTDPGSDSGSRINQSFPLAFLGVRFTTTASCAQSLPPNGITAYILHASSITAPLPPIKMDLSTPPVGSSPPRTPPPDLAMIAPLEQATDVELADYVEDLRAQVERLAADLRAMGDARDVTIHEQGCAEAQLIRSSHDFQGIERHYNLIAGEREDLRAEVHALRKANEEAPPNSRTSGIKSTTKLTRYKAWSTSWVRSPRLWRGSGSAEPDSKSGQIPGSPLWSKSVEPPVKRGLVALERKPRLRLVLLALRDEALQHLAIVAAAVERPVANLPQAQLIMVPHDSDPDQGGGPSGGASAEDSGSGAPQSFASAPPHAASRRDQPNQDPSNEGSSAPGLSDQGQLPNPNPSQQDSAQDGSVQSRSTRARSRSGSDDASMSRPRPRSHARPRLMRTTRRTLAARSTTTADTGSVDEETKSGSGESSVVLSTRFDRRFYNFQNLLHLTLSNQPLEDKKMSLFSSDPLLSPTLAALPLFSSPTHHTLLNPRITHPTASGLFLSTTRNETLERTLYNAKIKRSYTGGTHTI
ncbi:unnamed protein product [Phytophthora lilii]|uniref:Unnamed protein product n=1 Tax=Phytophthora lilii TaxID=2077276 RepID=A0A9W6UAF1_9STRA|nr:unnamed protein product [Phytophthora lilii]